MTMKVTHLHLVCFSLSSAAMVCCKCMPDRRCVLPIVQRSVLARHVGCNYVGLTPFFTVCLRSGVTIVTLSGYLACLYCLLDCQHTYLSHTGIALRHQCGAAVGSEIGHVLLVSRPY